MNAQSKIDSTSNRGTVVGLFKNQVDAERAIDRLKRMAFRRVRSAWLCVTVASSRSW